MSDGDYPDPPTAIEQVAPDELQTRLDAGDPLRLLDVRDRDDVERWRIDGPTVTRTTIPYAKFMAAQVRDGVSDLAADVAGEGPVTVVCGRGEASAYVAGLLTEAGIEARNLAGGMDAWGRLIERYTVSEAPTVWQYRRPATGCLSYAVVDSEALLVDPLEAAVDRYRADLGDTPVTAVDTHLHADHISGLRAFERRLVPAGSDRRGLAFAADTVADGDGIAVGETSVRAVALPGHTTEMTGFVVGDVLLSGDSVFVDGVARPDLQEDADHRELARDLYRTLTERLDGLGNPLVAPGHHGEGTTPGERGCVARLATIRERVAAFGLDEAAFVERVLTEAPEPANAAEILAVNRGERDAAGFELELGPNNCAARTEDGL